MTAGTSLLSPGAASEAGPRCHGDPPLTGEGSREMMSPTHMEDMIG